MGALLFCSRISSYSAVAFIMLIIFHSSTCKNEMNKVKYN
ncbi:hypothetical protein S3E15_04625 [Bacillus mycoides]|uniref:Uncharacterized protein n=1 Tax=Bacillus mycoides TaxID=1405 RepID=A0AAP7W9I4_BACMY|nr:hypothetical protein S3E15_04625 [Bacillus mycoides]